MMVPALNVCFSFCVLQLGQWDKALALAPAASVSYWCKLLQRRTDAAAKAGDLGQELLPFMIASGQATPLVEMLSSQKQFEVAAGVAAVAAAG
jgi:hypothetical protein